MKWKKNISPYTKVNYHHWCKTKEFWSWTGQVVLKDILLHNQDDPVKVTKINKTGHDDCYLNSAAFVLWFFQEKSSCFVFKMYLAFSLESFAISEHWTHWTQRCNCFHNVLKYNLCFGQGGRLLWKDIAEIWHRT